MLRFQLPLALASFALMVYCLIEAISTDEVRIRNLPKIVWILLILFFPLVGSIAWLVAGRPESGRVAPSALGAEFPEYDRPGRATASSEEKEQAFLAEVRARAEAQRKAYDASRRAEQRAAEEAEQARRALGPEDDPSD